MLNRIDVFTAPPSNKMPGSLSSLLAYLHEGYEAWLAIYGNAWDLGDKHPQANCPESCGQLPERIATTNTHHC